MSAAMRETADRDAIARVTAWTRERFALSEETWIVVVQGASAIPGAPALETEVAFWTERGRHAFKLFKPANEVTPGDIPPAWLKDSLVEEHPLGCPCC